MSLCGVGNDNGIGIGRESDLNNFLPVATPILLSMLIRDMDMNHINNSNNLIILLYLFQMDYQNDISVKWTTKVSFIHKFVKWIFDFILYLLI